MLVKKPIISGDGNTSETQGLIAIAPSVVWMANAVYTANAVTTANAISTANAVSTYNVMYSSK